MILIIELAEVGKIDFALLHLSNNPINLSLRETFWPVTIWPHLCPALVGLRPYSYTVGNLIESI